VLTLQRNGVAAFTLRGLAAVLAFDRDGCGKTVFGGPARRARYTSAERHRWCSGRTGTRPGSEADKIARQLERRPEGNQSLTTQPNPHQT
jgi:hypothetical protein